MGSSTAPDMPENGYDAIVVGARCAGSQPLCCSLAWATGCWSSTGQRFPPTRSRPI